MVHPVAQGPQPTITERPNLVQALHSCAAYTIGLRGHTITQNFRAPVKLNDEQRTNKVHHNGLELILENY